MLLSLHLLTFGHWINVCKVCFPCLVICDYFRFTPFKADVHTSASVGANFARSTGSAFTREFYLSYKTIPCLKCLKFYSQGFPSFADARLIAYTGSV